MTNWLDEYQECCDCGWIGNYHQMAKIPREESKGVADYRCPECGSAEFYKEAEGND